VSVLSRRRIILIYDRLVGAIISYLNYERVLVSYLSPYRVVDLRVYNSVMSCGVAYQFFRSLGVNELVIVV
jgi:hypothetical protein